LNSSSSFRIEQYTSNQYNALRELFQHAAPQINPSDYFFHNRQMYEWQYKGFGHEQSKTLLLYEEEQVVGFRGVIPGLYQVPLKDGTYVIEKGSAISGWLSRDDLPEVKRMGLNLHLEAQEKLPVALACSFGIDLSLPIYKMGKFNLMDGLRRYVLPLDASGYKKLIPDEVDDALINTWSKDIEHCLKSILPLEPVVISAEDLGALWKKISSQTPFFSLHKTSEYWRWRYIDCPAYRYLFWGDPDGAGVIVGRVESIFTRKDNQYDESDYLYGKKVLRLIELLPAKNEVWQGGTEPSFVQLAGSVLKWSREQGCLAADFQCSSARFSNALSTIGFKEQDVNYQPPLCGLAGLFQPLRFKPDPINAAWRVKLEDYPGLSFDANDTYFVKSDAAADHPKFWPLPKGFR
jgi:hypothetical protein